MEPIFISHTEKDIPVANEIIRRLEDSGYKTWHLERNRLTGLSWRENARW